MTKITPYGGANEIGGNKFLLEDKDAKIYLDFVQSFDFGKDYFYESLQPRTANGLEVYFEFNLIPKVPKLYSREMLRFTNLKYQKPDVDAVFISHSHADHTDHLPFLDESIPIYMGHGTKAIMDAYQKLFPGLLDYGEHEHIHLFKSGDRIKVKHLEITPVHVEHSIPGAYGFIIRTSAGNLVYTGDLRMHGPKRALTEEFIKKAAAAKPIALLCEGTRMGHEEDHNYTEEEVVKNIQDIVRASKGTAFVYFSMSNVDRFNSVYQAAEKNQRIMVVDTRLAYLMDALKDMIPYPDPLKDKHIMVYYRLAKTREFVEKDYAPWEREYFPKKITYNEIKKDPKKYIVCLGFYRLMELVYLLPKDADFIYSSSEHFLEGEENEDMRIVWENWMKHFKIPFHKAHCSGHAPKSDIIRMIKQINPKTLIPIHTQWAGEFGKIHSQVIVPRRGEERFI